MAVRGLEVATEGEAADLQRVIRANLAGWRRRLNPLKAVTRPSPPSLLLAFGADGRTALLSNGQAWDLAVDRPLGPSLPAARSRIKAFRPDGRVILTCAAATARLWDTATAKPIGSPLPHRGEIEAAGFSADGKFIVTESSYSERRVGRNGDPIVDAKGEVRLWDAATGQPLAPPLALSLPNFGPASLDLSPDGKFILTDVSLLEPPDEQGRQA